MKRGTLHTRWTGLASVLSLAVVMLPLSTQADEEKWNYQSHQTFKGQAFFKDTNLWVYTPSFGEKFGMPESGADSRMQGIEAAAFRIEPGRTTCGMAGKAENCTQDQRCMLDIYVDEGRHPLPWATDQQADWEDNYTSLEMLIASIPDKERPKFLPPGVIPNKIIGGIVRPFADPVTHREADFFHNANNPKHVGDDRYGGDFPNNTYVFGYRRHVFENLNMITLKHSCFHRNEEKPEVSYRLESRVEIASPTLSRFFEFTLPQRFLDRVDALTDQKRNLNTSTYKQLLNRQ